MKRFATLFAVVGLATAGTTALADEVKDQLTKSQPVQMTDAQLDDVAAGLVTVVLVDVVDANGLTVVDDGIRVLNNSVNGLTIQVPVAANVSAAVAVLGGAGSFAQQMARQLGRQP